MLLKLIMFLVVCFIILKVGLPWYYIGVVVLIYYTVVSQNTKVLSSAVNVKKNFLQIPNVANETEIYTYLANF